MKQALLSIIFIVCLFQLSAQSDASSTKKPEINVLAFIDVFYTFDFNEPTGANRQDFFYQYNRHNEFNLNMGLIQLEVNHEKYRSKIGFHSGTYANDNYVAEQGVFQNIYQANVGIALNKKNSLWLDAGIFESHLGFESALSIENWNLTRALASENSPYYLSGAKLNWQANQKWDFSLLVTNGWQRIQRVQGNSLLSFGTQASYTNEKGLKFNWSTFVGTDDPDSTRRMRYFNNLYSEWQISKKLGVLLGFDFGLQEKTKNSNSYNNWMVYSFITRYQLTNNLRTALRFEYFEDNEELIIQNLANQGFKSTSISLNIDFQANDYTSLRLEGRHLFSSDKTFLKEKSFSNNNFFITISLAMLFNHNLR
tara:strand:- start:51 stop:1151 length:1101 start_codon:yes stop_codon:yes gene_type:complete